MTSNYKNSMYPRSFLCEEAKIKQRTPLKEELCEIGEEVIWESRFTSSFNKDLFKFRLLFWNYSESFIIYPIYIAMYCVDYRDICLSTVSVIYNGACFNDCHQ